MSCKLCNSKQLQFQWVDLYYFLQDVVDITGLQTDAGQIQLGQENFEKHHHIFSDVMQTLLQGSDWRTTHLSHETFQSIR